MVETPAKLAIGMPVYNGETHLVEALESILSQSFEHFDLIISDNASTDATESICRAYARRDRRIRYYRNELNLGASANYNLVFQRSNAEYFKWASSNDLIDPSFLKTCMSEIEGRPDVVLCYTRTRLFTHELFDGVDYADDLDIQSSSPVARYICLMERIRLNNAMNGVFRSRALSDTALIKPYFSSDVDLLAALSLRGKFLEVPQFLFYRRMDAETATRMKSEEEVLRHYHPEGNRAMLLQAWRSYLENFALIQRAPIQRSERVQLLLYLLKLMVWARSELADELVAAATANLRAGLRFRG